MINTSNAEAQRRRGNQSARHREEQGDVAIQNVITHLTKSGLLRYARNDSTLAQPACHYFSAPLR